MGTEYKIIAETSFSHEGDITYLMQQIDAAVSAKVDIIKFQVLLDDGAYCCKDHPSLARLNKWCFTQDQWLTVFTKAKSVGLDVLVLPLTVESVQFCRANETELIDAYEVHPICINEVPLLKELRGGGLPIVLGVGGRLPDEIAFARKILEVKDNQLVIMYGFQSFPTEREQLNLNKIDKFSELFSCTMGFADHCSYDDILFHELNLIAYLKGCRWFEKHLVLDPGVERIDYEAAIGVDDFCEMRKRLDSVECVLGDGEVFSLNAKEQSYKEREKQLVFSSDFKPGDFLSEGDIAIKISNSVSDYRQLSYCDLIGRTVAKDVKKDQAIRYGDIE